MVSSRHLLFSVLISLTLPLFLLRAENSSDCSESGVSVVLAEIQRLKIKFASIPIFEDLRDTSRTPKDRFGFAPCMGFFVLGFKDLNEFILRNESAAAVSSDADPMQEILNLHSHEDDHHWGMYLDDMRVLGWDKLLTPEFLWGQGPMNHHVLYQLMYLIQRETLPIMRYFVVEAIEATGDVGFSNFNQLADEFHEGGGAKLIYYGEAHKKLESGHTMGADLHSLEAALARTSLGSDETCRGIQLVRDTFELFEKLYREWQLCQVV